MEGVRGIRSLLVRVSILLLFMTVFNDLIYIGLMLLFNIIYLGLFLFMLVRLRMIIENKFVDV